MGAILRGQNGLEHSKAIEERLFSPARLVLFAFLSSILACALVALQLKGVSNTSKLASMVYAPFMTWGGAVYLILGGFFIRRIRLRPITGALVSLVWLVVGAWVAYVLSLLGSFLLFFLATHIQHLLWIPVGMITPDSCYLAAIISGVVYVLLAVIYFRLSV